MAWKELHVVDQRWEFVMRALTESESFAGLCREYDIAPKTGYKWKERFLQFGLAGLEDQSRRPHSSPEGLVEQVVCQIIKYKHKHPSWGPRKIRALYKKHVGGSDLPSESSFKRVLSRAGLVQERKGRAASSSGKLQSRLVPTCPNHLWTVDFKGWWYTPGRARCEPLTVRDGFSRYVLCAYPPPNARSQTVQGIFEKLFTQYGLPQTIRSDNGRPFACTRAPLGLSRLSAWWVALGIDLDRNDPGHPEQNGAHERMHRDIASEVEGKVRGELAEQAAALEVWRESYNQERPHEALGMKVPAAVYERSKRKYTGTPEQLEYGAALMERKVQQRGTIMVEQVHIGISTALAGWHVGLKRIDEGRYDVHFGKLHLGEADVETESFTSSGGPPAAASVG